jgi:hypothetical protein
MYGPAHGQYYPLRTSGYLTVFIADPEGIIVTQNKTLCIDRYPLATRSLASKAVTSVYNGQLACCL